MRNKKKHFLLSRVLAFRADWHLEERILSPVEKGGNENGRIASLKSILKYIKAPFLLPYIVSNFHSDKSNYVSFIHQSSREEGVFCDNYG